MILVLGGIAPVSTLQEIIRACQHGSTEAFEQLVRQYQQYAFKIAYGILGSDRDAEDTVQEAFIAVYHQIKSLRNEEAFPTWLGKIVTNLCFRKVQNSGKRPTVPLDSIEDLRISNTGPEEAYLALELKQDVHNALLNLPLDYRVVVVLRDIQGYSYSEIADIAGIPLGTVKSRIHQARTLLADLLQPTRNEEEGER